MSDQGCGIHCLLIVGMGFETLWASWISVFVCTCSDLDKKIQKILTVCFTLIDELILLTIQMNSRP